MSNQLALESSPYLLQHQDNPVDWFPWGEAAMEKARREDKPIFLSIGYSACHWCHVMERESFESEDIAAILNEHFVSVKVDREERPDLDQIYMNALHVYFQMTGSPQGGGWPLSMFLTPQLKPFLGGTYWPPHSSYGRPGFADVLNQVANLWKENRADIDEQAGRLTDYLQPDGQAEEQSAISTTLLQAAEIALQRNFDSRYGGFGAAPKFPHPIDLQLLLRRWRREPATRSHALDMVTLTLEKMAAGGIYDHLGGGFARYSVDERWLVPHFEKMLYDNAMISRCYVEAYQATGNETFAQVARQTYQYVLAEMTDPQGGFYSALDADSEGVEGKYYVWTPAEVEEVLGPEAAGTFCYVYDVSEPGNFEGQNILNLPKTLEQCAKIRGRDLDELARELAESRAKLLEARRGRVPPGLDDKVLAGWNALMIDSLAYAAGALEEPRCLESATKCADFILAQLRREDGRLLHSWRGGAAKFDAYLDDHACLINALVTLYEAGFDERFIDEAVRLADVVQRHFADPDQGGYFFTADDHEQLIARQKDIQDSPTPSGNAMTAMALLRLGKLAGRSDYLSAAEATLQSFAHFMERIPTGTGQMLLALDFHLGPTYEIVILGDETKEVLRDLRRRFAPHCVVAHRESADASGSSHLNELFAGKESPDGQPAAYLCENFACQAPHTGKEAVMDAWNERWG